MAPGGNATLGALTATTYGHLERWPQSARGDHADPTVTTSFGVGLEQSALPREEHRLCLFGVRRTDPETEQTLTAASSTLRQKRH